jgi:hypothetical protein
VKQNKPSVYKERGDLLTLLLGVAVVGIMVSLFGVIELFKAVNLGFVQVGLGEVLYTSTFILFVTSVLGIFMWQRWAVYLFFCQYILGVIGHLFFVESRLFNLNTVYLLLFLLTGIFHIIFLYLWYKALKGKWKNFS